MGEAAPCLMRSVSQPLFASCEYKEGDPLRALTTSISFGRFMTEPLDWEKWSSFSHNRTLEDVQKHSRPGAVAEKKAFFEAHYKKIASKKATKTKSPQKENKPPNHSPQTNISPTRSDTLSPIDEPQENESSKPITLTTTIPAFSQHIHEQDIEIASCKDVCSPSTNLVLEQFGNVEDDMASSRCQVEVEQGKVSSENISLEKHKNKIKKGSEISLSKKETSRKTPTPPIRPKKAANDVTEKKRSVLQSLHMSMNFPPAGIKNRILKTISKPKDRLIKQPLNLKVSINGVRKASQVLPPPENKSVCTKKPKSSSSSSSTVPSSFSFRSEERAAKRKEFFQKLEEKGNKKETEKIHLQPKLKTTNDNKKLRRSTALEAKTFANETKVIRSSSIQKVPQMQPCSPKLGRKPTPRLVHKDTCCQSPSKPKNYIEINKKKLSSSMAFLTTKKKNDSSSSVFMSKKQC